jgi:hypothetical protein
VATAQPFRIARTVDLDGAGNGSVEIQPPSVDWLITGSSVETSTAALHPRADIAVNGGYVEGTYSGHRDSSNSEHRLTGSDVISCTWVGGDPGARATFRLWGRQYVTGSMP